MSATKTFARPTSMATPAGWLNVAEVPTPLTNPAVLEPAKVVTAPVAITNCLTQLFGPSATYKMPADPSRAIELRDANAALVPTPSANDAADPARLDTLMTLISA